MDITHCLQRPSQTRSDGSVSAGGERELIPWMGRLACAMEVHGLFLEVWTSPVPRPRPRGHALHGLAIAAANGTEPRLTTAPLTTAPLTTAHSGAR